MIHLMIQILMNFLIDYCTKLHLMIQILMNFLNNVNILLHSTVSGESDFDEYPVYIM